MDGHSRKPSVGDEDGEAVCHAPTQRRDGVTSDSENTVVHVC